MVKLMGKILQHLSAPHKEVGVENSYPNSSLFSGSDLQSVFFVCFCFADQTEFN